MKRLLLAVGFDILGIILLVFGGAIAIGAGFAQTVLDALVRLLVAGIIVALGLRSKQKAAELVR